MPDPGEGPALKPKSTDGTLRNASEAPEKENGGRLTETLDRTLGPRLAPAKPGWPKAPGVISPIPSPKGDGL